MGYKPLGRVKIIVVGGVAAGASAAAKARRTNENAEIVIFERGPYVSFANCGLPYYIGGEIKDREELFLQNPEGFWNRFRLKAMVFHEVIHIHRKEKKVSVKNVKTGDVFDEPYDKLILSPGAGGIVPSIPDVDARNIFLVKTVPDSDQIKAYISSLFPRRAIVIGSGFIGLESAEALQGKGLKVTLIDIENQVLPAFDKDMARFVEKHLRDSGMDLILGDGIKSFVPREENGEKIAFRALLASGRAVEFDMAILSMGVRPEIDLAKKAGLRIGEKGGITVDAHLQTSDPDIYAAGDAIETIHLVTGNAERIPLAGPANKQGRIAGANAAGGEMVFRGAIGTAIVESMGIVAAKTGLSEKEAVKNGVNYSVSVIHPLDHAEYYPGATMVHMKLVSEKNGGRILGAQIVGRHGVDKRIDVLATAIMARMTVEDLEQLDLAYAPQFSSAKDPVVMAGFVAAQTLRGNAEIITCGALKDKLDRGESIQLVDVRTREEHQDGKIPGSKLIPVDELRDRLNELDPRQDTVVYCKVGLRGYLATRILLQSGFKRVRNLTGGFLLCEG